MHQNAWAFAAGRGDQLYGCSWIGAQEETGDYYYIAGLLHDIGKIGLSDALLAKMKCDEPLSQEEEAAVRRHPRLEHRLSIP